MKLLTAACRFGGCRLLRISISSYCYAPAPETNETLALMGVVDARIMGCPWCCSRQRTRHLRSTPGILFAFARSGPWRNTGMTPVMHERPSAAPPGLFVISVLYLTSFQHRAVSRRGLQQHGRWARSMDMPGDLPRDFHPALIRASAVVVMPFGALFAMGSGMPDPIAKVVSA